MPANRLVLRSLLAFAVAALVNTAGIAQAQSVQQLLEKGALEQAVERAQEQRGDSEATYIAAQALTKMDNNGGAEERYTRLREEGDAAWKAIGESGLKLLAGDVGGAMEAANRAVAANGDNPYAHYQVGLVAAKQQNFQRSHEAFARAIELKPDFAYSHYYAGQAAQKLRQTPKMAEHFQAFVRLAPESPERQAVQAILRSLR